MTAPLILVPGAWMGAWIWEPTVARLQERGMVARTLSLLGLGGGTEEKRTDPSGAVDPAEVHLADHVAQVRELSELVAAEAGRPVLLVGHSYSSTVVGQVADQLEDGVAGVVHIGGFLPVDGRSLLDDWGSSAAERAAEAREIEADGNLWAAPSRAMLEHEPDLDEDALDLLARRFRPHPGRTVLEPATLSAPVSEQPSTYVALAPDGEKAAWAAAPPVPREASGWRRRHLVSGHWPMLSLPEELTDLLAGEVRHYG